MSDRRAGMFPSVRPRALRAPAQAAVVAGFVMLAILLGGASAAGITANAVLQVAGVIAIAAVLMRRWPSPLAPAERYLLLLVAAFALLYVLQSVPLPPQMWAALPGRAVEAEGFDVLGIARPAMPLSLAPLATLHSGVALLPPIAMMLMVARFPRSVARGAILALLAMMVVSVVLGVAQFSGSGAYLYTNSNGGSATGFFPNANHFATLMCVTMPLAAGLVARWRSGSDGQATASRAFAVAVLLGVVLLGVLGVAMTKSVAGLLLTVVAVIGSAAIVLSGLPRALRLGFLGGVVLVILVGGAVMFTGTRADFALSSATGDGDLSRQAMWRVTAHAIAVFGTVGAGFGSFPQVFHLFEDPARISTTFANHAHNDLLEFVLEGGIPGVALLVSFLGWFAWRLAWIWLFDRRRDPLAQGAAIAATIVLLHSLVDYPLRTGAIATLFGLCLALMARASAPAAQQDSAEPPAGRHLSA